MVQSKPAGSRNDVGPLVLVNNIGKNNSAEANAPETDIVSVHGLCGTRVGTWSKDGICWPGVLLQKDLENVRVITWGYDANIANLRHPAS